GHHRYYPKEHTLETIGVALGITGEGVRRIEKRALEKIGAGKLVGLCSSEMFWGPDVGPFLWRETECRIGEMTIARCDNCRAEYRPQREAQSYCNRNCRRSAAYGRERFKNGTKGRRKRRLEASDKVLGVCEEAPESGRSFLLFLCYAPIA